MPACSYSIQMALHQHDESDDHGVATRGEILAAFDALDWPGQIPDANRLQRVSPTFSVQDVEHDRLFWVSGCGAAEEYDFVCAYTYVGVKSNLFGLIKRRGHIGPDTQNFSLEEARRGIELLVDGNHDEILRMVS